MQRLALTRTPIEGASDHGVSEAIYLSDPDRNGIELYADRPREQWPPGQAASASGCSHARSTSRACSPPSAPARSRAPRRRRAAHGSRARARRRPRRGARVLRRRRRPRGHGLAPERALPRRRRLPPPPRDEHVARRGRGPGTGRDGRAARVDAGARARTARGAAGADRGRRARQRRRGRGSLGIRLRLVAADEGARTVWPSGQPGPRRHASRSQRRQVVSARGRSSASAATTFSSIGVNSARSSSVSGASSVPSISARRSTSSSTARCPRAVTCSACVRRSRPGRRSSRPWSTSRSTSCAVPGWEIPSTRCSASADSPG